MRYKRPSTAFFQYLFTRRDKIRESNPDFTDHQISKAAASEWNKFTAEEKKPYLDLYLKQKLELQKNQQFVPIIRNSMVDTNDTNTNKKRKIQEVLFRSLR